MTHLPLFQQKEKEIHKLMKKYHIFEKDIKESFIRSSGPGGQNVNKVASCVQLIHIPTQLTVKCQEERSQALNRYKARYLLVKKIEQFEQDRKRKEIEKKEKIKRQSRRRSGVLQEEVLLKKHQQSEKKSLRKKITPQQVDDYDG